MYELILGYILGIFTVLAWNLQKSGKVNLALYQWLIVALVISVILYFTHRFISFDFSISKESFLFSLKSFLIPLLLIATVITFFIYRSKKKKDH